MAEIRLKTGEVAFVDDADFERLNQYRWSLASTGHAVRYEHGTAHKTITIYMHQDVMGRKWVDHRDTDKLNNRRDNLRPATQAQNNRNRRKKQICSSRFKGVFFNKRRGYWQACIKVDKVKTHLGCFQNETVAARAYDEAAIKLHGEFASLNGV